MKLKRCYHDISGKILRLNEGNIMGEHLCRKSFWFQPEGLRITNEETSIPFYISFHSARGAILNIAPKE